MEIYQRCISLALLLLVVLMAACATTPAADTITASHAGAQRNNSGKHLAPVTVLTAWSFNSPLAAVMAAENKYNPISIAQDREFIGAIVHHNGTYRYSVGRGLSGEDTVTVRIAIPRGARIVAFWHTHGAAGHGRRYFSGVDTALANSWNTPFYMADHSGTLRVFHPGDATMTAMQARRLDLGDRTGFAKGRVVKTEDNLQVRISTRLLAQR